MKFSKDSLDGEKVSDWKIEVSNEQTLKAGVEQTIKRSIPNIKEVISVN